MISVAGSDIGEDALAAADLEASIPVLLFFNNQLESQLRFSLI